MLREDDQFVVTAGEYFGFIWRKYGYVSYDKGDGNSNYCLNTRKSDVGDTVSLKSNSKHMYSFQVFYECSNP